MKFKILIASSLILFFIQCKKTKTAPVNEVYIDNIQFSPSSMTVARGTTVKWRNQEAETHTVSSDSTFFNSGDLSKNQTFSFTFQQIGTFPYHCNHHGTMKAKIIVQ